MGIESLVIRRIAPNGPDIDRLHEVAGDEHLAHGVYTREEVDAMHDRDRYTASWLPRGGYRHVRSLGAEVDGKIIGCIQLLQRKDDGYGILEFLYVEPDSRGKKIAAHLIGGVVWRAQSGGYPELEVNTMLREPEAVAFWEKFFRPMPPSTCDGHLTLLGNRSVAIGWRLPPDQFPIAASYVRDAP